MVIEYLKVTSENTYTLNMHVVAINERRGKELERAQRRLYRTVWKEARDEKCYNYTIICKM